MWIASPRAIATFICRRAMVTAWSESDGQSLLFSANRHEDWEYDPQNTEVYEVSAEGGDVRVYGLRASGREVLRRRRHDHTRSRRPLGRAPNQAGSRRPRGSSRRRSPVAAKIALATAGATGGTPGSPTPAGGASLSTRWTWMLRGTSFMRTSG